MATISELAKSQLRVAIQIALAVTSAIAVFSPSLRTSTLHTVVGLLFIGEAGASIFVDWRAGLLSCSPSELYRKIKSGGRPRTKPLATLAWVLGFFAVVVIAW